MTIRLDTSQIYGRAITRGKAPRVAAMLQVPLDFTATSEIDCSLNVSHGISNVSGIDGIQSVYIDNSLNGSILTLQLDNGPYYVCPPYSQAVFPLFFSGEMLNFIAVSAGAVKTTVTFLNTREQAQIWSARALLAGNVNISGSQVYALPQPGTLLDSSGVLAAAGVSQQLIAANANRLAFTIRNPALPASQGIAAPEPVYLNFGAAAAVNGATSWELLPGETIGSAELGIAVTGVVNWTAATVNHILIAKVA